MTLKRDEVFDEIQASIEDELELSNPYNASVLSYVPSYEFDELPIIVLSQIDYRLVAETLNKQEKRHELVIEAQIFSIDEGTTSKRTIGNLLADVVEDVIQNKYGLNLEMSNVIPNLDENIYRIVLRFRGIIDDNTKIIYR